MPHLRLAPLLLLEQVLAAVLRSDTSIAPNLDLQGAGVRDAGGDGSQVLRPLPADDRATPHRPTCATRDHSHSAKVIPTAADTGISVLMAASPHFVTSTMVDDGGNETALGLGRSDCHPVPPFLPKPNRAGTLK